MYVDAIDDNSFLEKQINDPNEKAIQEVVLDLFQKNREIIRQSKEKNENSPFIKAEKKKKQKIKSYYEFRPKINQKPVKETFFFRYQ